jgi:hypothetical protein
VSVAAISGADVRDIRSLVSEKSPPLLHNAYGNAVSRTTNVGGGLLLMEACRGDRKEEGVGDSTANAERRISKYPCTTRVDF